MHCGSKRKDFFARARAVFAVAPVRKTGERAKGKPN